MGAPQKNHDWREERRMRAWNLKQAGWKQTDIATALGVTEGAVSQWLKRGREQGVAALKSQPSAGPQPRLTREQHEHLRLMLAQGALAHGYHEAVWTSRRVADLIQQTFGVRYHRAHCSRLLRALNQSVQNRSCRPGNATKQRLRAGRTNAGQRSKKAEQEGRRIIFVDESGFYLLPMVVRTYAPVGQTPILKVTLTHDHLSVIGAITAQGQLLFQMQDHSYCGADVVRFLRLLLRKLPGKLLVIWDGSPIHRGQAVKAFLARGAAKRIHLERLPGYAPDLNPEEGIWNLLKRRELKNVCCHNLADLALEVRRAKARLRHRTVAILACFAHAACPL